MAETSETVDGTAICGSSVFVVVIMSIQGKLFTSNLSRVALPKSIFTGAVSFRIPKLISGLEMTYIESNLNLFV